tara:strand:+ start:256 stop:594 length:339 start_codon:yes stop_codon:yes gene_type:complete
MGRVKSELMSECGCLYCDMLFDQTAKGSTETVCSHCSKFIKHEAVEMGILTKGESYVCDPYESIRKTMDAMTEKAIDKSIFVEYERGYREGVMETLKLLIKNISEEGESNAS